MSDIEKYFTVAFYLFWTWRILSFLYTTYKVYVSATPTNTGYKVRSFITVSVMLLPLLVRALPWQKSPHLSLINTIWSIPSQVFSILFLNRYIARPLDSRRINILVYTISFIFVIETLYLIHFDLARMKPK